MKKILSIILAIMLISSSTVVFANVDMNAKLEGHWSKDMLQKDFVAYYFPYLARNSFEKLDPTKNISKKDIALSLGSLSKDYNLHTLTNSIIHDEDIKRIDLVNMIGERLIDIEELNKNNEKVSFNDISDIKDESKEFLGLLYNSKIVNGVSAEKFAPNRMVSQAEAIIMLQRTKTVLEEMKEISFEVKGVVQSYNSRENVIIKEKDDSILVTITKQFPTPGYSLGIEKIVKEEDYKIILYIGSPASDAILPQVITYKTITIEIDKSNLRSEAPYTFTVEGIKSNLTI